MTYKFEFLNGSKSAILQEFSMKYKQRNLTVEEKEILYNYKNNVTEITDFLLDIQMLIFYLHKEKFYARNVGTITQIHLNT